MPCDEILLHALFDGELEATEATRVEQHVKDCPQCQRLYAELEWLHESLRPTPIKPSVRRGLYRRLMSWGLGLAASLAVVLGGSHLLIRPGLPGSPSAAPGRYSLKLPEAVYEVSVQDCQLLEVEIRDDQQVVRLDTGTAKSQ